MGSRVRGARLSPAGNPQILVIEGEPGIGKTAFVHQFLSRASGVTVLEASGEETEAAPDWRRRPASRARNPGGEFGGAEREDQCGIAGQQVCGRCRAC